MKRIRTIIGMCILSLLSTSGFAAPLSGKNQYDNGDQIFNVARDVYDPSQEVTDTVETMMRQNNVPGMAVALYVNGRPYLYHFGVANKMTMQPVTGNTIFELGSITKTFTTLLLGMEIQAGRMHLHDSVARYASALQSLGGAVDSITLEQLATHTSSLPYELPDYYISSEQTFARFLDHWRPYRPIGSTWQYSNIGFGLLGYMLEGATDESYDQLLHERVLNPLGMDHTEIEVPPELESDYAQGYNWGGAPAKQWRHNDAIPAEGSIKSTSEDMLKYLLASLGVSGTPSDIIVGSRVACSSYVATRYGLQGLAWEKHPLNTLDNNGFLYSTRVLFIRDSRVSDVPLDEAELQSDNMLIDKTGTTEGFTSYIALIPSQKIGIVLLANRTALREQIGEAGRKILLSLMETQPQIFAEESQAAAGSNTSGNANVYSNGSASVNVNANSNSNMNANTNAITNTSANANTNTIRNVYVNSNAVAAPGANSNTVVTTSTVNSNLSSSSATDSNISSALAADTNTNPSAANNTFAPRVVVTAPNDPAMNAQNNTQSNTLNNVNSQANINADNMSSQTNAQMNAVNNLNQNAQLNNDPAVQTNMQNTAMNDPSTQVNTHIHVVNNSASVADSSTHATITTVSTFHAGSQVRIHHTNTAVNEHLLRRHKTSVHKTTVYKSTVTHKKIKSKSTVQHTKKTTVRKRMKKTITKTHVTNTHIPTNNTSN